MTLKYRFVLSKPYARLAKYGVAAAIAPPEAWYKPAASNSPTPDRPSNVTEIKAEEDTSAATGWSGMTGTSSITGGVSPSVMYTCLSVSRNCRSKASSLPELWSAPYHQNQSEPSAMYIRVCAWASASGVAVRAPVSYCFNMARVSARYSQARFSSSSPIQVEKSWPIHEPAHNWSISGWSGASVRNSLGVTVLISGSLLNSSYSVLRNSLPSFS